MAKGTWGHGYESIQEALSEEERKRPLHKLAADPSMGNAILKEVLGKKGSRLAASVKLPCPNIQAYLQRIEGLRDGIASSSNLACIPGPSRTGDIDLSLTAGVHGPGEMIVNVWDGRDGQNPTAMKGVFLYPAGSYTEAS